VQKPGSGAKVPCAVRERRARKPMNAAGRDSRQSLEPPGRTGATYHLCAHCCLADVNK
jgi:hypothetical protein